MKLLKKVICCFAALIILAGAFSVCSHASWYDDIGKAQYSPIIGEPYVAETFCGVQSRYSLTPGSYQCTELIMRFYKEAYGLNTFIFADYGKFFGQDPIEMLSEGYKFIHPDTPQTGDIIFAPSRYREGRGDHWAIVKSYSNGRLQLFEQNVKYNGKAGTGRSVKYPSENYIIYSPRALAGYPAPKLKNAPATAEEITTLEQPQTTAREEQTTVLETTTLEPTTLEPTTLEPTTKPTTLPATTVKPTERTTVKPTERTTVKPTERTTVKATEQTTAEETTEVFTTQEVTESYSAVAVMAMPESTTSESTLALENSAPQRNLKPIIAAGAAILLLGAFLVIFSIISKRK